MTETHRTYVPPHLRNQGTYPRPHSFDLQAHSMVPGIYTSQDIADHFGNPNGGTLTGSINHPTLISRILVFKNQHPHYPPKIFIKTNLNLLFEEDGDGNVRKELLDSHQIPLFTQTEKCKSRAEFEFGGWAKVTHVERLKKGSEK